MRRNHHLQQFFLYCNENGKIFSEIMLNIYYFPDLIKKYDQRHTILIKKNNSKITPKDVIFTSIYKQVYCQHYGLHL